MVDAGICKVEMGTQQTGVNTPGAGSRKDGEDMIPPAIQMNPTSARSSSQAVLGLLGSSGMAAVVGGTSCLFEAVPACGWNGPGQYTATSRRGTPLETGKMRTVVGVQMPRQMGNRAGKQH